MAKIALEQERLPGTAQPLLTHPLSEGAGWAVYEVVCTSGPRDRPFEERHTAANIAIVTAGTFQYRSPRGSELMAPGSLFLGNPGEPFECSHEHATGDRCVSFAYAPGFFEQLAADAGAARAVFCAPRLPPVRPLSPLIARVAAAQAGAANISWEELAIQLAAQTIQLDRALPAPARAPQPGALARVTRVVRLIESAPEAPHDLAFLAQEARLSPFHFLRVFEEVTGATPHQYLLRLRLRRAAVRLRTSAARILDIALDCGFGDISNFNRTFRAEFGVSPRHYRSATSTPAV